MYCFQCIYFLLVFTLHYASSTEITVSTYTKDHSLGMEIELPVLICHVRHTDYKMILWYKDGVLLKSGYADLADYILPLSSLLDTNSSNVTFNHPLKLQGYYSCKTEKTNPVMIFNYLFRINEIYTYAGKFIAEDSLGDYEELSVKMKIHLKKSTYEEEMQKILFGFLTPPNVFVTDIKELHGNSKNKSLEVRFFLYVRQAFHPRKPVDNAIMLDEDNRNYVFEYLNNDISSVNSELYQRILEWISFRGIEVKNIQLKSTLGCYENKYKMPIGDRLVDVTWPYARIGDIVISERACSAKNGLAVTRKCNGSFSDGATWLKPYERCGKLPKGTTAELKRLYDTYSTGNRSKHIEKLVTLMKHPSQLDMTGLHIAAEILKALSLLPKLEQEEISGMLSVIDKMVEVNRTELNAAKNLILLTNRILKILDNILNLATKEKKEIQLSTQHLLVDTKYTKMPSDDGHILGFAVTSPNKDLSLENASIEFVLSKFELPLQNVIAYFSLPNELVSSRESIFSYSCQVNMVFFKEWYLFHNPKDILVKRNYKVVPTPVMYVSLSGGPEWNLTDPVQLYFKDTLGKKIENPVCVYYEPRLDDGAGAWSPEGCVYGGLKNGFHHCQCHHLSIFAVILSQSPYIPDKFTLGTSVYVGCGVSIVALSFAILLFVLSKHWRLTIDHYIIFSLSLTFLACIILIFISELHFLWTPSCMVLALLFHYTIFAILGWLLVQAIVYRLRFAKKTDVSEIPHFILKAAFIVWGAPIVIVIIIWLSKEYSLSGKDNCWLTVSEVSKVSVIPVVVLMLVILCVNVCATYSLTCRFKKDFLVGDSHYSEPAVKFRVAFTIFFFFVLTWLFGFFALHERSQELRILFSISITLTSYYVALFFIFQEISFWELCSKCKQKEKEDQNTPVAQYEVKSYSTLGDATKLEKY